jgi:hypothetical protein
MNPDPDRYPDPAFQVNSNTDPHPAFQVNSDTDTDTDPDPVPNPDPGKKISCNFFLFIAKYCNLHYLGLLKGRPIYRRSRQPSTSSTSKDVIAGSGFDPDLDPRHWLLPSVFRFRIYP